MEVAGVRGKGREEGMGARGVGGGGEGLVGGRRHFSTVLPGT